MEVIKNSPMEGKQAIAIVGDFRIPVLIVREVFSHGKQKFYCKPVVDGVTGSGYIQAKDLIV